MCRQLGATRAPSVEEAFEWAATLATQPLPRGRRVVVFSTVGGWGVLAADACAEAGLGCAMVRSAVGSLVDGVLGYGAGDSQGLVNVEGPGIEILTLGGEVRPDETGRPRAHLAGTISDADAQVYGGTFLRGQNTICITLELVLQEWIPDE